jgi:choice-of-anchor B domain-containing protein
MKKLCLFLFLGLFMAACSNDDGGSITDPPDGGGAMDDDTIDPPSSGNVAPKGFTPCEDGMAGPYPCNGFDLLGHLDLDDLQASAGNDIWGWTDPDSGREYALVGLNNGTAFVDISDTDNLVYVGKLPTATTNSAWRDIKVYQNHAFIVSEADGHGMQVFDLTRLRSVSGAPLSFTADARYTGFGDAHNIVINEDTGFAYAVGTARNDIYNGGVHFINISDPQNPVQAGGYAASGYTHDAQVVNYNGPDTDYTGREIFVGANESLVVVVDVTDKQNPTLITDLRYSNTSYTHQGWFTEDQRYFIFGDEGDEMDFGFNSRTLVFDFSDLDNPSLHATYLGPSIAIDHNGYVLGDEFFLANYTAGMRVVDLSQIEMNTLAEEAFFDSYPSGNNTSFNGVWSVYPYFSSGKVVMSDINSGLFVVERSGQP